MSKRVCVHCGCDSRVSAGFPAYKAGSTSSTQCPHLNSIKYAVYGRIPERFFELAVFLKSLFRDYPERWKVFNVFHKLLDWPTTDFDFTLTVDEAREWYLELDELKQLNSHTSDYPHIIYEKWIGQWSRFYSDPRRIDEHASIVQQLDAGLELCKASIETGNPIEFHW